MTLRLHDVSKTVDGKPHIHPVNLELEKGTMNVLLGPTSAGKTSLMRLMAGLDTPDTGAILWEGRDVTGARVQTRDVAMVYQQFVNYPAMSVYDNIASPLKIQGKSRGEIDAKVREMAQLLKLTDLLDRRPAEISGGQQQRCAIARALAKDVGLVLMDEPLANLDYKLREELRVEIPRLFAASGAIFVYATTEPEEALLLGGNTATLWEGRVTQFGPSMQVYREPVDEITARVYSDPPMNFVTVRKDGAKVHFPGGQLARVDAGPADLADLADGEYRAGFRAHDIALGEGVAGDLTFAAKVNSTELTGSETFLHLDVQGDRWTALVRGPQVLAPGSDLHISLDPARIFYFDTNGKLARAPQREAAGAGV
ncbi:ABC transporter ATP-binding protein [Erythrobacter longus]|uniref:ABC transporter ATP-binding protein n=1 Tax=Erythrobacter longus TaxID=1044 RepID=A0A074MBC2_ERYLO|nr:ABC transporter ATP-binding protein [Erythrobacter longus]KEO90055.1 ABC transporter ATP-binding protein [Erythrobacter longus]